MSHERSHDHQRHHQPAGEPSGKQRRVCQERPENEIWKADVTACETSIRILAALSGEGCTDLETTLDFLQDYNSLAKQYQALHRKYETPGKPTHKDGVWHCPACNCRVQINHSHCRRCGKKIGWR